jgi:hypothetical protein
MAKVKGTGMLHVVKALRVRRNHVEALLPERLRHYLEEKILVASWYPAEDLLDLLRTLVHFVPKGIGNAWWWMGEQGARSDLAEVYAAMVQKGNAWATMQRLPRLWRLYHDAGKVEVGVAGSTRAQVILTEVAFVQEDFGQLVAGYLCQMLRTVGAEGGVKLLASSGSKGARWLVEW